MDQTLPHERSLSRFLRRSATSRDAGAPRATITQPTPFRQAARPPTRLAPGSVGPALRVALGAVAASAAAAAAYMLYEAQAVECRTADLPVPGLPPAWRGTAVLHLADVHAGLFPTNERSLAKAVIWAEQQEIDLVFLTGDILGDPGRSRPCLRLLARLRPRLGMFAVTGNHEYGLGKGPLAKARDSSALWEEAGVVLLKDSCHRLPVRAGSTLVICGADYLTGGFGLLSSTDSVASCDFSAASCDFSADRSPGGASGQVPSRESGALFPILLIHEPPPADSPLACRFPLAFAGHTHGGQLRVPTRRGLRPLYDDASPTGLPLTPAQAGAQAGVCSWGSGSLVISRGLGTSFLPFRLLTRPEATLWRLV